MAPRRKNASIKSTGSTSSKAEPLPDWVKNKSLEKPPPKYTQQQQANASKANASPSSSKGAGPSGKQAETSAAAQTTIRPPPLFPPGTKTPINLLNERIQKHHAPKGWLKPNIDARRASADYVKRWKDAEKSDGEEKKVPTGGEEEWWTFVVTLTKTNKSDQAHPFVVRMDAADISGHEGSTVCLDSKEKAKHWGATYSLHRICSNLSLEQVLPTGPREYWKTLASHKAKAPDHLAWLWAADPFEAKQKMQVEKEAKVAAQEKRQREAQENGGVRLPRRWQEAREIRMAKELRDLVEETVREALVTYPMDDADETNAGSSGTATPNRAADLVDEGDYKDLIKRLTTLGFRLGHARSAVRWLIGMRKDDPSALSSSLRFIAKLSDEEACLEYLAIFCPEDDLPARFTPSRNADSFVTGSASSNANAKAGLAERWIEDRLIKLAGYPRKAVEAALVCVESISVDWKEAACTDILLRRLCRMPYEDLVEQWKSAVEVPSETMKQARADERMALEAVLGPERIIEIATSERPLIDAKYTPISDLFDIVISEKPQEDIRLRVCTGATSSYPSASPSALPTFFVASTTLPAYIRLAMTQRLGRCLAGQLPGLTDWSDMLAEGQGGVMLAMVEELESCWERLTQDPPDLSEVMAGVAEPSKSTETQVDEARTSSDAPKQARQSRKRNTAHTLRNDDRVNQRLKSEHAKLQQSEAYASINAVRVKLPALASAKEIISLLEKHRLLIIAGETGCGKTTQCPQFILDHMIESGQGSMCNVVVTQPRRLSTMAVATRVAQERCESINENGTVGYAIRGETKSGRNTKLLFTTTGVLLRRLSSSDPDLRGISHVFVDEVHERGVDSDLLLLELRQVLQRNPDIRVVLMSATIERETFTAYFPDTPTITIPGRTFPVTDFYLEDVKSMLGIDVEDADEKPERNGRHPRESIDYELLGQAVSMICKRADKAGDQQGSILVFLPGVGEIRRAIEAIGHSTGNATDILPLHANLSPEDQRVVFRAAKKGKRKVICSTNVAETSITIDDVVYVVDTGLVKETRYDSQSGLTKLVETHCSQANAKQRRGRAGRVQAGECFRMYTRSTERNRMQAQQVPEMLRMSLENLVLNVKALKGDTVSVEEYLGSAISPPSMEAMSNAIHLLSEMNVLLAGQRLTALGKLLSLLPLDVRLAKAMVLGCVFHCLEPMLTAAAILSSKPLFNAPFDRRDEASKARSQFAQGSSDILTDVRVYDEWIKVRKSGMGAAAVRRWCEENFISASSLRDIASARNDLTSNLVEIGFVPLRYRSSGSQNGKDGDLLNSNADDVNLQRALLLAALHPSVVRIIHPSAKYDKAIGGTVERQAEARQVHFVDAQRQRVFLHPSSVLFSTSRFHSDFLTYFRRGVSTSQKGGSKTSGDKIFLRDATDVPIFALLLFGGQLRIHRRQGGISLGTSTAWSSDDGPGQTDLAAGEASGEQEGWIRLRTSGRIAALINQLRFLLDAALARSIDDPMSDVFAGGIEARVRDCLHALLRRDGL